MGTSSVSSSSLRESGGLLYLWWDVFPRKETKNFIHFFYAQREEFLLNERKEELLSKKKKHDDERGGVLLFYRQSLDHLDVKIVVGAKVLFLR